MKILDAGDAPLSNADVLDWLKRKRAQHETEDEEDKAKGLKPSERPKNFIKALNRTERELSSDKYPYVANPTAYEGDARRTQFQKFVQEADEVIQTQLLEEWADALQTMSQEQVEKEFHPVQDMKNLTEPELLMIYNIAPTCVEMLQPIVENVEDRFTAEEQQVLVDVIMRVLRPDETQG
jgi:hypothetical protein